MKKITPKIIGISVLFLIISCNTYIIPTESFREQISNVKPENMKLVEINNPLLPGNIRYYANNLDRIIVVDKDGHEMYLENSPAIEMRITRTNGKKHIVYFDTVFIENDTLKSGRSRFVKGLERQIPMDSIVKIEVQDGGKNFYYINK